ncbi:TPA: tetratricopeptide repeat protein [Vibrio metschnikovii]
MRNLVWVGLVGLLLSGCVSSSGHQRSNVNDTNNATFAFDQEQVLIKTGNYTALIEFYKQQLQQSDQRETRLKLAQAYLDFQDPESALFILGPLVYPQSKQDTEFYLQGVALYRLNRVNEAQQSLTIAQENAPNNAQTINMLGIIFAQFSQFEQARASFNRARELMYDDITVKNNLALIDILEEDYQSAADRLLPIYHNGQADDRVIANLAIIMAKSGSFQHLQAFYAHQYSEQEIQQLFITLRNLNLVSTLKFEVPADTPIIDKTETLHFLADEQNGLDIDNSEVQ